MIIIEKSDTMIDDKIVSGDGKTLQSGQNHQSKNIFCCNLQVIMFKCIDFFCFI